MTGGSAWMRFDRSDGGWLQYAVAGDGEPVVFLHGFGLDSEMWEPQWDAFSERHRVIRYDLRGYGRSSLPVGTYSHVDDLLGLIDFLRARPAHLVGLSMGGRIALRVAAQAPEAVRSLTLVDAALDGHAWSDDWSLPWREMTDMAARGDVPGAKQLWLNHDLFEPARSRSESALVVKAMVERYSGWHLGNRDPGAGPAPPPPEGDVLRSISAPALVIVGERDLPDFQVIARRLADTVPDARLRVIPGSGHMANLEAPQMFNELVLEHLARCRTS